MIRRGNDRQPCFFAGADYLHNLQELRELALKAHCLMHAYVLMTNHVHLLVIPPASGQIGRLMQALGRRYARYVNDRYRRTGTLWEGRYKACLVDRDTYLLHCYRYIELNPARPHDGSTGRLSVVKPCRQCVRQPDPLIHLHPNYIAVGSADVARQETYRAMVRQALSGDGLQAIRLHLQRQHALGSDRFRAAIEAQLGRRAGPSIIERPHKNETLNKVHSDTYFR